MHINFWMVCKLFGAFGLHGIILCLWVLCFDYIMYFYVEILGCAYLKVLCTQRLYICWNMDKYGMCICGQ